MRQARLFYYSRLTFSLVRSKLNYPDDLNLIKFVKSFEELRLMKVVRKDKIYYSFSLIKTKWVSGFTAALILALPGFFWIVLDRGIWRGDPVGYALHSISLYHNLATHFPSWKWNLFHGYKGPLIYWTGQFLVPLGNMIGSLNFSLLLIPFISFFITLILSFRSFELLFKNKAISYCGCLAVAASPLLNGLSTQFWIEPMQTAITGWFIYAMINVRSWNFYFSIAQFILALSLAILIKVSTPLYLAVPAIVFLVTLFRSSPSMKIDAKNVVFLAFALLVCFSAVAYYYLNFHALRYFAHFAATSPLFASDESKYTLWLSIMQDGVAQTFAFDLSCVLMMAGVVKTIKKRSLGSSGIILSAVLVQIVIFFIAWVTTANVDPRYFIPIVPYFALLVCWGLAAINHRLLTASFILIFMVQFINVNGFAFGLINSMPPYGAIRPLIRQPEREQQIIHDIMPWARQDSSIIFDLSPELGVAEFQYELAKENLWGNWLNCCVDIGVFFNIRLQVIDTTNIKIETVWNKVLAYNPDYYITWNSRLSPERAKEEMQRIDRYNAITVPVRWKIAGKIKNSTLYETVYIPEYPDLLVFKRRDTP